MRQAAKKSNQVWRRYAVAALLIAHFAASTDSQAFPYELSYASRITDAQGVPLTGPVDIQVDFFTDPTNNNSRINIPPVALSKVPLADGVFQLSVTLTPVEFNTVFANSDDTVYIQVTDVTHGKTFQRQQFGVAPYALKIPIDNDALRYNNQGQLTVGTNAPATGQVLMADGAGKLKWTDLTGPNLTTTAPSSGQILGYNGTNWVPQTAPSGGTGGGGSAITSLTGDVVASGIGSLVSVTAMLSPTGVTPGTYSKVTVDAKGRVQAGASLTAADIPPLSAGLITSGTLSVANGGTGVNSTATFPASGVVVTESATETLTNKTLSAATINGASSIGGSTTISTTGTAATGALTAVSVSSQGNVTILGNSTTANKLVLNDKGSTNSIALKAPDTLASSFTLELPSNNGSTGQVLSTNGSGTLSWVSAATGSVTNVMGTAPISVATGTSTPVISMSQANGTTNGYLGSADWNTFNSKQSAGNFITALTGDLTAAGPGSAAATLAAVAIAGTSTKVTYDVKGRVTSGTSLVAGDIPPLSAAIITSGTLGPANGGTGANLSTTGGAGQYLKQSTSGGSVSVGTIGAGDITSSLGYTPLNKAGDTVTGALNLSENDLINVGNIRMAALKTLALSGNTTDPTGLVSGDKGKTWFNSTSNQIKYWDGSTAVALGVAGSGLSNFNGQTGNTQTFATPGTSGTAPAWSSASNAHTLNIPLASTASVTAGLISNSDYNTFNGKLAGVTSGTGVSVSTTGNIATVNLATVGTVGTYAKVITDAYGRVSSGINLVAADLPPHSAALITSGTLNTAQLPTIGSAGTYAKITTDAYGRVSNGTTLAAADLPPHSAALITSGTLSVASGGTGVTSTPTNGQVLIGNGTNYSLSTLTAGIGVSINNASGAITISTSGVGSVTSVSSGAGLAGGPITSAGTLSLASVGAAGTYAKVTTDAYGRVTSGTTLASSDITSSLGFTPINKAGDTMTGTLVLPANGLTAGTNQLVLTVANVGIGTSAPVAKLDVEGSGGVILNAGNVGIGTTSPSALLEVKGAAYGDATNANRFQLKLMDTTAFSSGTIGSGISFGGFIDASGTPSQFAGIKAMKENATSGDLGGNLIFNTRAPGPNTVIEEKLRITGSGNVGIGTTYPIAKLHVNGQIVSQQPVTISGSTVDFSTGNIQVLTSVGGGTITLNSMLDGAAYTLFITDTTNRTYFFPSCTNTHWIQPNATTNNSATSHTMYSIVKLTISTAVHCYISWITGI